MRTLQLAPFLALVLVGTPAIACSPIPGYRVPTNVELVQSADLVILARVVAGPSPNSLIGAPWSNQPQIILEPVDILKGQSPKELPRLFGTTSTRYGEPVKPAFTPLTKAHPSAYAGGCVRDQYAVGTLVVAMFKLSPDGLKQLSFPFARQVEDVASPNAIWVKAVRLYVEALQVPTQDRRRKFVELKSWLAMNGNSNDDEIGEDVDHYLAPHSGHPSEMW